MAARTAFGRTWWGQAWVEAMERVDYNTNRLPRGRRYARNGSVLEIRIDADGNVGARVQGTRRQPYKIGIKLKDLPPAQASKVKLLVGSSPAIASELSLGKLPERLLGLLEEAGIPLFPRSWRDVKASCSCPDWANPCKHLAAVFYIVANEIDKDPFIVFNLRGISTASLVEAAGMVPQGDHREAETDAWAWPFVPLAEAAAAVSGQAGPGLNPGLDLSFPRSDLDGIFTLLQESPLFWESGNFKKVLRGAYGRVSAATPEIIEDFPSLRGADFFLVHDGPEPAFFIALDREDSPPLKPLLETMRSASRETAEAGAGEPLNVRMTRRKLPSADEDGMRLVTRSGILLEPAPVLDFFLALPLDEDLARHSESSRALCAAGAAALALAMASSFVPSIAPCGEGAFTVKYLPLAGEEKVKRALARLDELIPADLGYRRKDRAVYAPGSAYHLVSLFLDRLVNGYAAVPEAAAGDGLARAFFAGEVYQPSRFEEKSTATSVSNWLERLAIRGKAVSPVIRIEALADDLFGLHVEVEDRADQLAPMISLSEVFASKGEVLSIPAWRARHELSRQIAIAGEYLPQLLDILDSRGVMSATVGPAEMAGLLTRHATALGILGIRLVLPRELAKLISPKLALRARLSGGPKATSYLSLENMLEFDWEVSLGGEVISREEFMELARSAQGVVRYRDGYLILTPQEAERLLKRMSAPPPSPSSMELLHWALAGEERGIELHPDRALANWLKRMARPEKVEIPSSLSGSLRPYQERGFCWLYTNAVRGIGSCLADDMGLGKTIQAIALLLALRESKARKRPALVVCPTTVVGNWRKELERFAPSLRVSVYHGADRRLAAKNRDVVVTTYGILRRDLDKFKARDWGALVIDEAQNIKNPRTDQARAVKSVKADCRVALSGTPVENHLGELWSIFDFLNPGYLGSAESFRRDYAAPIEKFRDAERIDRLRRVTAPFIMRRLKSDRKIITDLPEKITTVEYCYLTAAQAALYQKVVDEAMKVIESSDGIQRRGLILKLITSLKQVCDHPALFSKKGRADSGLSGKAARTLSLVENVRASGEKALIFTQYVEMGKLLLEMLGNETDTRPLFFHGGIPRGKRDEMVREFQEGGSRDLMVVSLRAGGTGLNLTAASNVIHYDLWWNPAVEEQATDRTYRIGQDRDVYVHRMITLNTFEERIEEMMRDKRELAELTVSAGEKWITELSNRELKEIFALRE